MTASLERREHRQEEEEEERRWWGKKLEDLKDLGVTDSLGWLQRECFISKSPAAKKREEEAENLAEAATRKSEARRFADLEEKDLEKEEQAALEKNSDEVKKKQSRTVEEEEYERMVVVENKKRDDSFRRLKASFKKWQGEAQRKVLCCLLGRLCVELELEDLEDFICARHEVMKP
ncbi:unnamed protein product [Malus baccata var. baccata]